MRPAVLAALRAAGAPSSAGIHPRGGPNAVGRTSSIRFILRVAQTETVVSDPRITRERGGRISNLPSEPSMLICPMDHSSWLCSHIAKTRRDTERIV